MTHYNLEKIIKIRVYDAQVVDYKPKYQREIKILGIKVQKEGIRGFFGSFTPMDKMKETYPNHFIKDGKMWENPELTIYFSDDFKCRIFADTKQECIKKANEIMNQCGKWFELK